MFSGFILSKNPKCVCCGDYNSAHCSCVIIAIHSDIYNFQKSHDCSTNPRYCNQAHIAIYNLNPYLKF